MEQLESRPLSNTEIINKMRGRTNIVMYPDLEVVRLIEDIMVLLQKTAGKS